MPDHRQGRGKGRCGAGDGCIRRKRGFCPPAAETAPCLPRRLLINPSPTATVSTRRSPARFSPSSNRAACPGNGKAKNARTSIDRIRAVMHHFQGELGERKSTAPSRKLWTALHALDGYLTGQSDWMVNYAERHRAGLRVGTAITEGTANFLVNRRMNKSQQMRWSPRGADLLLQVRCAVYNGTLGSAFGQNFQPANDHIHRISRSPPDPQSCGSPPFLDLGTTVFGVTSAASPRRSAHQPGRRLRPRCVGPAH